MQDTFFCVIQLSSENKTESINNSEFFLEVIFKMNVLGQWFNLNPVKWQKEICVIRNCFSLSNFFTEVKSL